MAQFSEFGNNPVLLTNSGLAEATGGGRLQFTGGSSRPRIVNHWGGALGEIIAKPGSVVELDRVTLEGGLLTAASDPTTPGEVRVIYSVLDDVTLGGAVDVIGSTLAGTITNPGLLRVKQALTAAAEEVTLTGGGEAWLGDPAESRASTAFVFAYTSPEDFARFVNEDNTMRGQGTLSLSRGGDFVNRGLIETGFDSAEVAAPPIRTLTFSGSTGQKLVNSGVLRATAGNLLRLTVPVDNDEGASAGVIEALAGGTVELSGSVVTGGVLRAAPADTETELPAGRLYSLGANTTLQDLRLEGTVGDHDSRFAVAGRVEVAGSLVARELLLKGSTELVGGEVHLAPDNVLLNYEGPFASELPVRLALNDTTLRLAGGSSNPSSGLALEIVNRGAIVAEPDALFNFALLRTVDNRGLIHAEAGARLQLGADIVGSTRRPASCGPTRGRAFWWEASGDRPSTPPPAASPARRWRASRWLARQQRDSAGGHHQPGPHQHCRWADCRRA